MGRRTPVGPRPGRRRGVNFTFFPVAAGSSGLLHLVLLCLCATLAADLRCYAQRAPAPAPASAPTLAPAPVTGPLPPPKLLKSELDALRQIYVKLKVPAKTWNFSTNPCDPGSGWGKGRGIDAPVITNLICDCVQNINRRTNVTTNDCRVSSIQLKSQNLTGVLPEELANLTSLAQIDLSRNYLSGSLPASWSTLPLVNLTLLGNRITGSIPEVYGNIKTLNSIVLENNLLNGTLPATLGRLSNLSRLLLSANDFVGEIPVTFAGLTNLTDFRIDGTGISGKIPDFIGKWTQLTRLDVQGTSLKGPFPSSFSNLKQLLQLRITDLEGGSIIPPLDATDLTHLILRNCSLSGEIPVFIGNLKNLKTLDLSFNNLTGQIPSSFDALSALKNVYLTSNALSGSLPSWVSKNKKNIDVSYNSFTGNPPSTCTQGTLNLISSYSSSTSSSAPSCLRKDLPCAGKPKNYKLFINCGGNAVNIDGDEYESDSVALGPSTYFSPSSGDRWAFSSTGDFVGNDQLGYIANNVTALDLTNGTNPALYMQARVNPLSLKYYGLCLQKGNYTVKLHFSEIMFTSDQTYFAVGRRFFDVSIQGKKVLPNYNIAEAAKGTGKAVIESFNATVEDGTLEIHFQWAGKGTNAIPERGVYGSLISAIAIKPNFNPDLGKKELSTGAIVGITVAACVAFFLILLMLLLLWRKKKHEDNEELKGIDFPTGHFTLRQIKAATGNFDPAKKIGEGGFGPVFKGELPDGSLIAVKQLSSKSRQGNREFVNEIGMITALQHPNLVKLFGCCIEANQLLLIYEYLENNSLARALFGPENQRIRLDWQMRGRIAMDIARGLAYLHEESRLKIVHRDIKATNVLLDKDLNAKISDFGLAKLDDEENTHISTRIAGTVGYMAPEYAMRGYLTDKADVYSFGVVLLEIVSGKSNTSYKPKDDFIYLLDWAYVLQERGTLLDLVDPSLGSDYSKEEAERMLRLALICTSPSPSLRPAMTMVVCMLEGTMPVGVPQPKLTRTESEEMRFKTFERLSHDSHVLSTSMDGPWANSSTIMSSSSNGHSAL